MRALAILSVFTLLPVAAGAAETMQSLSLVCSGTWSDNSGTTTKEKRRYVLDRRDINGKQGLALTWTVLDSPTGGGSIYEDYSYDYTSGANVRDTLDVSEGAIRASDWFHSKTDTVTHDIFIDRVTGHVTDRHENSGSLRMVLTFIGTCTKGGPQF